MKTRKLFWTVLTMLSFTGLQAQILSFPISLAGPTTNLTQHLKLDAAVSLQIGVTGNMGNVSWAITTPAAVDGPAFSLVGGSSNDYQNGQITITVPDGAVPAATRVQVAKPAPGPNDEHEVSFTLTASDPSGRSGTANVKLVLRRPLKLVFVVDRSGSMECGPNRPGASLADWPSCTSDANKKWNIVRDALDQFANKMNTPGVVNSTFFPTDDGVSVVYFDGDLGTSTLVDDNAATPLPQFRSISDFAGGIVADFDAQLVGGALGRNGTSMGDGLKNAVRDKLGNSISTTNRQVIVLITDGQENAPLMVSSATGTSLDDGTNLLNDETLSDYIQVYSIGFDDATLPASYGALLARISTNNPLNYFFTTANIPNTPAMPVFDQLFSRIFDHYSPQIIRLTAKPISRETPVQETFPCDKYGTVLHFSTHFENTYARNYSYTIEKDGVPISPNLIHSVIGVYSALHTISFIEHPELSSEGNWTITCRRNTGLDDVVITATSRTPKVSFLCTVDDHIFDAVYSLGHTDFVVGDGIAPSVKLTRSGIPLTNATVKAKLIKPGDDKGDLIARARVPSAVEPGSEINNKFTSKYAYLTSNDPAYLKALEPVENEITLTHQGNGLYTGSLGKTAVSGSYRVVFTIEATDSLLGQIERYNELDAFVRFGALDHDLTTQRVASKGTSHTLTYTPAFKAGGKVRLVGPGYEHNFSVKGAGLKLGNVTDNGDGSYQINLSGASRGNLYLFDEEFYAGRLSDFGKAYSRYKCQLSLHAGATQPLGDLDSLYNGSFFIEADFGYRIRPALSLEAVAGYYAFKQDFSITGGTVYIKGHFNVGNAVNLTLAGGGGFYKPNNGDATGGYSLRVGGEKAINQHWVAALEASYFNLPDPKRSFGALGLGVKYRF